MIIYLGELLYGSKNSYLKKKKKIKQYLQHSATEKILKVSLADKITNEELYERTKGIREIWNQIKKRIIK